MILWIWENAHITISLIQRLGTGTRRERKILNEVKGIRLFSSYSNTHTVRTDLFGFSVTYTS